MWNVWWINDTWWFLLDETTFKLVNKFLGVNISLFPDRQDPVHWFPHLGVFHSTVEGARERQKDVCKKYSQEMEA